MMPDKITMGWIEENIIRVFTNGQLLRIQNLIQTELVLRTFRAIEGKQDKRIYTNLKGE